MVKFMHKFHHGKLTETYTEFFKIFPLFILIKPDLLIRKITVLCSTSFISNAGKNEFSIGELFSLQEFVFS